MVNKTALTILVSIILTTILVSTVNVGINLFVERPEYSDFCDSNKHIKSYENATEEELKTEEEYFRKCNEEHDLALIPYNNIRYAIFAILGFALLLIGLFFKENLIQITGLATGGILVAQGVIINSENKTIAFVSLLAILAIFGVVGYRVINKKEDKKSQKKKPKK